MVKFIITRIRKDVFNFTTSSDLIKFQDIDDNTFFIVALDEKFCYNLLLKEINDYTLDFFNTYSKYNEISFLVVKFKLQNLNGKKYYRIILYNLTLEKEKSDISIYFSDKNKISKFFEPIKNIKEDFSLETFFYGVFEENIKKFDDNEFEEIIFDDIKDDDIKDDDIKDDDIKDDDIKDDDIKDDDIKDDELINLSINYDITFISEDDFNYNNFNNIIKFSNINQNTFFILEKNNIELNFILINNINNDTLKYFNKFKINEISFIVIKFLKDKLLHVEGNIDIYYKFIMYKLTLKKESDKNYFENINEISFILNKIKIKKDNLLEMKSFYVISEGGIKLFEYKKNELEKNFLFKIDDNN